MRSWKYILTAAGCFCVVLFGIYLSHHGRQFSAASAQGDPVKEATVRRDFVVKPTVPAREREEKGISQQQNPSFLSLRDLVSSESDDFWGIYKKVVLHGNKEERTKLFQLLVGRWRKVDFRGFCSGLTGGLFDEMLPTLGRMMADQLKSGDAQAINEAQTILFEFVFASANVDTVQSLEWARQNLFDKDRDNAASIIGMAVARQSFSKAIPVIRSISDPQIRESAIESITDIGSEKNPKEVVAWAETLANAGERRSAMVGVMQGTSIENPEFTARYYPAWSSDEQLTHIAKNVARYLGYQNAETSVKWSENLPGEKAREIAVETAMGVWAQKDLEAAMRHFYEKYQDKGGVIKEMFYVRAREAGDLDSLTRHYQGLKDESVKAEAIEGLVRGWAYGHYVLEKQDLKPVVEWISALPQGALYDSAAGAIVYQASYQEPEGAWDWAMSIRDPARRLEWAAHAIKGLAGNDSAAALRKIQKASNLSEAEKTQLLQVIRSPTTVSSKGSL